MLNNLREICDHYHVTGEDYNLAVGIVGSAYKVADLTIAPDGKPYLYRWHVVPQSAAGNVYFHIQVADDPERPLHDHPWDNTSVILSGGYTEIICLPASPYVTERVERLRGDTIFRMADWGHRLLLPGDVRYTMTLFSTGPKIRKWGFWYPDGWVDADQVCRLEDGVSKHVRKEGAT